MVNLRCLSLFANVGIAEAMFAEIGVRVLIANEIVEERAKFYREVYPDTHMIVGDITDDSVRNSIVKEAIEKKINFIVATPPCQGMSVAGNRDDKDPRNQLIFYAIDVIKRVNPDFVMLENVPRQLTTIIRVDEELVKIPDYIKRELEGDYCFNSQKLCITLNGETPEILEVFDYCYGVLYSSTYRAKYSELLSIDFPRVPIPADSNMFHEVTEIGRHLRKIHLLELPIENQLFIEFCGTGDNVVSHFHYNNERVYINRTQYFSNVREDIWDFCFAGYHGMQKWFKDRSGELLSPADVQHIIDVFNVFDLTETDMTKVDSILGEYEII